MKKDGKHAVDSMKKPLLSYYVTRPVTVTGLGLY
jgi:hypothetical protein